MVTSIQLCEVSKHCLSFQREREIRRERHEYDKYKPRLFLCEFLTCMCFMFFKGYVLCKPSVSYSSTELHISIATETPDGISYWLAQQCEIEKERERERLAPKRRKCSSAAIYCWRISTAYNPHWSQFTHAQDTHTVSATVNNGNWMPLHRHGDTPNSSLKHLESFRPIHDPDRFPMVPRSSHCQGRILDRLPVFQN